MVQKNDSEKRGVAIIIMAWVAIISIVVLFMASCTTEKKATKWFDEHKKASAQYCNENFPPTYVIDTLYMPVDSTGYWESYFLTSYKIDSLLDEIKNRPDIIYIPGDSVNLDSLRKAIKLSLLKTLKPCVTQTKVVLKEKRNLAAEYLLQSRIDSTAGILKLVRENLVKREDKISQLRSNLFWLWLVIIALVLYVSRPLLKLLFLNKI